MNYAFRNKGLSFGIGFFSCLVDRLLDPNNFKKEKEAAGYLLDSFIQVESEISWLHYMAPEASWLPWQRECVEEIGGCCFMSQQTGSREPGMDQEHSQ